MGSLQETSGQNFIAAKPLTRREKQVAVLAATGFQDKVIAGKLHTSARTIAFHISNICHKLGISNRKQLAAQRSPFAAHPEAFTRFTVRQMEATRFLAKGMTSKEIAREVGLSESMVNQHIANAMKKACAQTRPKLIAKYRATFPPKL